MDNLDSIKTILATDCVVFSKHMQENEEKTLQSLNDIAKDKTDEYEECQRTTNDLEAELRTRMREKDKLKAVLSNLQISLKREQNKGADAEQTNQSLDVQIRQKNVHLTQKQNELTATKDQIEKVNQQNTQLNNDIEDLKGMVLMGPPGTGKTSTSIPVEFFSLSSNDID